MEPQKAYSRVTKAASLFLQPDTKIVSKRIDSTLRGNLGQECDALLDLMPGDIACFVVPAFPEAGRAYHEDSLYVYDTILTDTAVANDPTCPLRTASAKERFQEQSNRKICVVSIQNIRNGAEELLKRIQALYKEGNRIILFEADTEQDIEIIAQAAVSSEIKFFCADPGPFTAAVVKETISASQESPRINTCTPNGDCVLAVVGSVNQVSCEQVEQLRKKSGIRTVVFNAGEVLNGHAEQEVQKAVRAVVDRPDNIETVLLVLSTTLEPPEIRLDFAAEAQKRNVKVEDICNDVNRTIAEVAAQSVCQDTRFGGMVSCGGDISSALFHALGINCMEVLGEVLPMAVCAKIRTGHYIVTKGGMIGGPEAMCACVEHIQRTYLTAEKQRGNELYG